MVYWTDFEFLCMIVAWVDITLYGLLLFVTGTFIVLLMAMPAELYDLVHENPEEHEELWKFLSFSPEIQYTMAVFLFAFWVLMFVLSLFLLKWAKQRYVRGLKIWFMVTLVVTIIGIPMDVVMLMEKGFGIEYVATFVVATLYCIFALWVVGSLIRIVVKREGQPTHTVEFQSL